MPTPQQNLAAALKELHKLQKDGRNVFRSAEFPRLTRERLVHQAFLQPVIKGWLISAKPGVAPGDSTPWYASFWEFCAQYGAARFGERWHLSPEQSLLLHGENSSVPAQVLVYTPKGTNNTLALPFGTSLFDLKEPKMPASSALTRRDGLTLFTPEEALVRVPEAFFTRNPIEAQVVLGGIRDASSLLRLLLDGGHPVVAGRLAGALRRLGRGALADEILKTMKAAGYPVRETDPFTAGQPVIGTARARAAPIVGRLHAMWQTLRQPVVDLLPPPPCLPKNKRSYMKLVEDIYRTDAYHSLSIEGYRVTPELIDKVASGAWNPSKHDADRESRDALAARGYWQAFQSVKGTVADIIAGGDAGALAAAAHRDWYRELFQPCVAAGLIPAHALAGYRNDAVFIRASRHVPPRSDVARDAMPALFALLEQEKEPSVRAVLGHWLFGYIHPYFDGNGRMARFLMNAMLASGGYPWTVIRVEHRARYLSALERASVDFDIRPFATLIAKSLREPMPEPA
jgi:fido (protein-threonine AMPylation protein)